MELAIMIAEALTKNSEGNKFVKEGDFKKAENMYKSAIEIFEKICFDSQYTYCREYLFRAYKKLAVIYHEEERHDKAITYYKKAIHQQEVLSDEDKDNKWYHKGKGACLKMICFHMISDSTKKEELLEEIINILEEVVIHNRGFHELLEKAYKIKIESKNKFN